LVNSRVERVDVDKGSKAEMHSRATTSVGAKEGDESALLIVIDGMSSDDHKDCRSASVSRR